MLKSHLIAQLLKLLAASLLLISFAMLSRRRTQRLITLFAWQGAILFLSTCLVAYGAGLRELYYSAALTLILKVIALPWILHRLIQRLGAQWDSEPLVNIPTTMLVGMLLVIFAFGLAQPISVLATTITRNTLGIALAVIFLAFLMMITRRKAVTQVIGFLAMENGLFFAATSATYGMPMVIELGIALDLLVGVFILGIFFFQIREQFDSLDLHHLEALKED
jgi:hydrogenase-4 component E